MSLSRNELLNIICICCGRKYGDHCKGGGTKFNLPELMMCMLRLQGTIVADGISNSPEP
jgi:hypothetical protein